MAENDYYFDGDPSTDSARRHLERLLKEPRPRRKWPWIAAAMAGAAAWYFWPTREAGRATSSSTPGTDRPSDQSNRAKGRR